MDYTGEELLPIVKRLAEQYTGKASSSITYEKAEQLMGAVLYCLREPEERAFGSSELPENQISAWAAYEAGYNRVKEKVKAARRRYNSLSRRLQCYGNTACRDTILKGMPAFFRRYDARFAPQETLLTLDYPILGGLREYTGIDAIDYYLRCVCLEQDFLSCFPPGYVEAVLRDHSEEAGELFLNMPAVVMRRAIGGAIWERWEETEGETERLYVLCETILRKLLIAGNVYSSALFRYLKQDFPDFAAECRNAEEQGRLESFLRGRQNGMV
jgi:hypothetical protein